MILFGVLAVVIAIALLSFIDRIRYKQLSPKELAEIHDELKRRLQNPDFDSIEKHFGHTFPETLKSLYADSDEILSMNFSVAKNEGMKGKDRFSIASFEPADMKNIDKAWLGCAKYFCFANDLFENGYLVDPTLEDPPVKFHDLEKGTIKEICPSLSEFLTWPKFDEFAKE